MCTGQFVETDLSKPKNGLQRPQPGTQCLSSCQEESGRWGSSWCYTDVDNIQWGAQCIPCSGMSFKDYP